MKAYFKILIIIVCQCALVSSVYSQTQSPHCGMDEQVFFRAMDSLNNLLLPIEKRNEDYKKKDYYVKRKKCVNQEVYQHSNYIRNIRILDSLNLIPNSYKELYFKTNTSNNKNN